MFSIFKKSAGSHGTHEHAGHTGAHAHGGGCCGGGAHAHDEHDHQPDLASAPALDDPSSGASAPGAGETPHVHHEHAA